MIRIRRDQEITPKSIFVGGPLEFAKARELQYWQKSKMSQWKLEKHCRRKIVSETFDVLRFSAHETYFRSIQRWFWLYQAFQHAKSGKCNSTNSVCASLLPSLAKQVPNCAGNMIWEHNACKGYVTITLCMHLVLVILDYSRKYLYPIMVGINILLPSPLSLTMKIPKCNLKMLYHPLPSELHLLITAPSLSEFPLF